MLLERIHGFKKKKNEITVGRLGPKQQSLRSGSQTSSLPSFVRENDSPSHPIENPSTSTSKLFLIHPQMGETSINPQPNESMELTFFLHPLLAASSSIIYLSISLHIHYALNHHCANYSCIHVPYFSEPTTTSLPDSNRHPGPSRSEDPASFCADLHLLLGTLSLGILPILCLFHFIVIYRELSSMPGMEMELKGIAEKFRMQPKFYALALLLANLISVIPYVLLLMWNTYKTILARVEAAVKWRIENVRWAKKVRRADRDGDGKEKRESRRGVEKEI